MYTIREQLSKFFLNLRKPRISLTSVNVSNAYTLNDAFSGAMVLLDKADGGTITLPTTPDAGTFYDFVVSVSCTSNSYKVITGSAPELIVGSMVNCDTDTSNAVAIWPALVGSSFISVNLNGSTKGGIKGDSFRLTCLNATTWLVTGLTNGTGVVATPFATS